ncbi:hypothetical protein GFH48_11880 [Streptomyces fagopyri]|uniref:Gliding motility protein n=1 Tax=Streptomyces fagopyri TaxID=2662397 RepID=A0A5Q0LA04_9ACTN|nr:hypothetical protein GFH48_11880 [Streptomyces fagopyri]
MGVFARLLRRPKAAEEASPAEVPAGERTAGTGAGSDAGVTKSDVAVASATTDTDGGVAESADRAEEVERAEGPKGSSVSENGERTDESDGNDREVEVAVAATGAAGAASSDDVEIPQQQTAEKAADNGAGESARK